MKPIEAIKKAVAVKAVQLIQNNMTVGLGTGTTAAYFIEALAQRCQEGLKIQAMASSDASRLLAEKGRIPLLDPHHTVTLDITVDGADEIDDQKRMIKGGGGALVREKIVAAMSRELVIIVDETKVVSQLGKRPLPVEIIPFASSSTIHHLEKLGYQGTLRQDSRGTPYRTDNGNWIWDVHLPALCDTPETIHEQLRRIPGVVDTGFFFHLAGRILIGFFDGQIVVRQ